MTTPNDPARNQGDDAMKCDCLTWATDKWQADMLGNGHHHKCPHFKPDVGALALIASLAKGIKAWADEEDGVPDWLWESYGRAVFITTGRVLKDGEADATPPAPPLASPAAEGRE